MSSKLKKMARSTHAGAAQHGPVTEIKNDNQFRNLVGGAEGPVVVDFWAPWCQPCKLMAPVFEAAARDWSGQARFVKVNTEATPSLARALQITSIPTLLVFLDGEVVDTRVGLAPKAQLDAMVRRAVDKRSGVGLIDKLKRWAGKEQPAAAES